MARTILSQSALDSGLLYFLFTGYLLVFDKFSLFLDGSNPPGLVPLSQSALDSGLLYFLCTGFLSAFGRFSLFSGCLESTQVLFLFVGLKDGGCWSVFGPSLVARTRS
jgi:hypothetical protein